MKTVVILEEAVRDLEEAFDFYEKQEPGAGEYFATNLLADIEKLSVTSGIHRSELGFFKKLSEKFPFAVYYKENDDSVDVYAILDLRKKPSWTRDELQGR
jgi:plasmid stabilization system protein ParE